MGAGHNMKILILTLPLRHNYGGILQAFALQRFLAELGHDVTTLNRREALGLKKQQIAFYLKKMFPVLKPKDNYENLEKFRDKYLKISHAIRDSEKLKSFFIKNNFDAVVVGSDQVWRPKYSPCLPNFFLDFVEGSSLNIKKISYAASFGVDDWEFTKEQTTLCKSLIQKFDAISVREKFAVELCQKYFDVKAEWVVDPTLLLSENDYKEIFKRSKNFSDKGSIAVYLLDHDDKKKRIALDVADSLKKKINFIMPQEKIKKYIGVDEWLASFYNADFVVTDSFHGCVFSIIFNKPFIALGNKKRGLSRFYSLLSLFELEDRLILVEDDFKREMIFNQINWCRINNIRFKHVEYSKNFLISALG
jgi:polysaccharide pyruvyl transferase WcaK-like protein